MILVICESPGKIQKISKILGSEYLVVASVGHIIDLDSKTMSIDIENDFQPIYKNMEGKSTVILNLKSGMAKCKDVLIATDEDREGEMIAWSIAYVLGIKNAKRITFNSITKKELQTAINNPKKIDYNLVQAQKARRVTDRLIGYELSPLLMKYINQHGLSAGRVQSVVTELIIDKEDEINKFFKGSDVSFFKFKGEFNWISNYDPNISKKIECNMFYLTKMTEECELHGTIAKYIYEKDVKELLLKFKVSKFRVFNVFEKESINKPSPPFTTSTLQQEANRKFGMSVKRTMDTAQILYEQGYITYMRTDSVSLSDEALENIKQYVLDNYGKKYYNLMKYKSKSKNTQEAHEAIRPTDVFVEDLDMTNAKLTGDCERIYRLIWKRTVASQMKPAKYSNVYVQIIALNVIHYYFESNFKTLSFPGYLSVYNIKNIEEDEEDNLVENIENDNFPMASDDVNAICIVSTQDYNKPQSRYNQASLVDKLDPKNLNIGRPSTYASIINKIVDRRYVEIKNIPGVEKNSKVLTLDNIKNKITEKTKKITLGKENNKFVPTHLGRTVNTFLTTYFPEIMDYKFTADVENKLDEMANGNLKYEDMIKEFYDCFHPSVLKIKNDNMSIPDDAKEIGNDPESGNMIYATHAKYGPVIKVLRNNKIIYAPIKEPLTVDNMTLDDALSLLQYPKILGLYKRKPVYIKKGKFGVYLSCGDININMDEEVTNLNDAIALIESKQKKALKEFASEKNKYFIYEGEYGLYVHIIEKKSKKSFNIGLSKDLDLENLTYLELSDIIKNKINKMKGPKGKGKDKGKSNKKTNGKKVVEKTENKS